MTNFKLSETRRRALLDRWSARRDGQKFFRSPTLRGKLSIKRIEKALRTPGRYTDGNGLILEVREGSASWLFRRQFGRREMWLGLGSLREVGLDEARSRAAAVRTQIANGRDPRAERRKEKAAALLIGEPTPGTTFRVAAERFLNSHAVGWRNVKHVDQWRQTLGKLAHPVIGHIDVAAIDTDAVLRVLEPHWKRVPETASRLRARIERVLDWAKARDLRTGENPARWKGHLDHLLPPRKKFREVRHHAAVPVDEMPEFIVGLRRYEGVSARALEFLILTAARTGEIIGAKWPEIDLEKRVWTIPAARTKTRKEHRVPLSSRAMEILQKLPREDGNEFVFIGGREGAGLSSMAMLELMKHARPGYVPHGFRSSFRDWCAERTNYPREVAEAALAHAIENRVEAAYRRGDLFAKRIRLMTDWGAYIGRPKARGNVVEMRKAARP
jgi:integrase